MGPISIWSLKNYVGWPEPVLQIGENEKSQKYMKTPTENKIIL